MSNNFFIANRNVLVAGVLCAILSYIAVELLHQLPSELSFADAAGTYLPGFLFGAIMLAPRVTTAPRLVRQLASVVVGTLLYYLTIQIGVFSAMSFHFSSSLAGMLAALVGALATCLAARWLIPMRTITRDTWRKAVIFGALGGAVLGISPGANASKIVEAVPIVIGLVIWQAGVAAALFGYSSSSK